MLLKLQDIIINFSNIYSTSITRTPSISKQPILHIPTYAPTSRDSERVTWGTSFMGKTPFKHLTIAFSVNYHVSGENCNEKINDKYNLENTVLYLERYKMNQRVNATPGENLYKPEIVFSSETFKQKNINLYISPVVFEEDKGLLESGCQIIYLASEHAIEVGSALKRYVSDFKRMFQGIGKNDNYVFHFKVVIKTKNNNVSSCESIELYTNLFVLNFDESGHIITLEEAQLEDYLVKNALSDITFCALK